MNMQESRSGFRIRSEVLEATAALDALGLPAGTVRERLNRFPWPVPESMNIEEFEQLAWLYGSLDRSRRRRAFWPSIVREDAIWLEALNAGTEPVPVYDAGNESAILEIFRGDDGKRWRRLRDAVPLVHPAPAWGIAFESDTMEAYPDLNHVETDKDGTAVDWLAGTIEATTLFVRSTPDGCEASRLHKIRFASKAKDTTIPIWMQFKITTTANETLHDTTGIGSLAPGQGRNPYKDAATLTALETVTVGMLLEHPEVRCEAVQSKAAIDRQERKRTREPRQTRSRVILPESRSMAQCIDEMME